MPTRPGRVLAGRMMDPGGTIHFRQCGRCGSLRITAWDNRGRRWASTHTLSTRAPSSPVRVDRGITRGHSMNDPSTHEIYPSKFRLQEISKSLECAGGCYAHAASMRNRDAAQTRSRPTWHGHMEPGRWPCEAACPYRRLSGRHKTRTHLTGLPRAGHGPEHPRDG